MFYIRTVLIIGLINIFLVTFSRMDDGTDDFTPPNIYKWIANNRKFCSFDSKNGFFGFLDIKRGRECTVCPKTLPHGIPRMACAELIVNKTWLKTVCQEIPTICLIKLKHKYEKFYMRAPNVKKVNKTTSSPNTNDFSDKIMGENNFTERLCVDTHELCCFWAISGECNWNHVYMKNHCPKSCAYCGCNKNPTCRYAMDKCYLIQNLSALNDPDKIVTIPPMKISLEINDTRKNSTKMTDFLNTLAKNAIEKNSNQTNPKMGQFFDKPIKNDTDTKANSDQENSTKIVKIFDAPYGNDSKTNSDRKNSTKIEELLDSSNKNNNEKNTKQKSPTKMVEFYDKISENDTRTNAEYKDYVKIVEFFNLSNMNESKTAIDLKNSTKIPRLFDTANRNDTLKPDQKNSLKVAKIFDTLNGNDAKTNLDQKIIVKMPKFFNTSNSNVTKMNPDRKNSTRMVEKSKNGTETFEKIVFSSVKLLRGPNFKNMLKMEMYGPIKEDHEIPITKLLINEDKNQSSTSTKLTKAQETNFITLATKTPEIITTTLAPTFSKSTIPATNKFIPSVDYERYLKNLYAAVSTNIDQKSSSENSTFSHFYIKNKNRIINKIRAALKPKLLKNKVEKLEEKELDQKIFEETKIVTEPLFVQKRINKLLHTNFIKEPSQKIYNDANKENKEKNNKPYVVYGNVNMLAKAIAIEPIEKKVLKSFYRKFKKYGVKQRIKTNPLNSKSKNLFSNSTRNSTQFEKIHSDQFSIPSIYSTFSTNTTKRKAYPRKPLNSLKTFLENINMAEHRRIVMQDFLIPNQNFTQENNFSNCYNSYSFCEYWADRNECTKNPKWMKQNCQKACHLCEYIEKDSSWKRKFYDDESTCVDHFSLCNFWKIWENVKRPLIG